MARNTRSAAIHEKSVVEKPAESVVNKPTKPNKKRKRLSNGDSEAPAAKHPRSDDEQEEEDIVVKDDKEEHPEEGHPTISSTIRPPLAGESTLREEDARKILDILEVCDTQGLLDRVFPLHDDAPGSSSPSPSPPSKPRKDSASLRVMLQEPDEHSLRVLRAAVNQLFPISSQPRSRTSKTAEQQLRFCQLALSLLEQASVRTIDIQQITPDILFPNDQSKEAGSSSGGTLAPERRRKYALMQTLPSGEWWTSLNSESTVNDSLPLNELSTANADLVSILPAPSTSTAPVHTLGELTFPHKQSPKPKFPTPRRVKGGHFLDYGPYASFAPSFDTEGAEVGRFGMGQWLWMRLQKGKAREKAKLLKERFLQKPTASQSTSTGDAVDLTMDVQSSPQQNGIAAESEQIASSSKSGGLEDSDELTSVLDRLGLEEGVTELLAKNSKGLIRLEELQIPRYSSKDESGDVKVGSEEWEIAQKLKESFALLTSLRPRLPSELKSAIIPPASVLRTLHKTLPSNTNQGWYGTLADGRKTALHDDTTIFMSSMPQPAPAPVSTTPVVPTPAPVAPAGTSNYGAQYGNQYNSYAQQYRGTYQTPGYYGNSSYPRQSPAPSYSSSGYPPQQHQAQYGWQQNYPQYGATSGPASGRGTPQPQASGMPAPYPGYPPPGVATPLPARAVANTVTGSKPSTWGGVGMPSTLPPHMRAAAGSPAVGASSPLANYSHNYGHTSMPAFQPAPPAVT